MSLKGHCRKLSTHRDDLSLVQYSLPLGTEKIPLNPLLGKRLSISWTGSIRCIHCDRPTKKSFQQGYCYPCTQKLAQCDLCIVKPELCHFKKGTCREPEWGLAHCFIPHTVYLANSSGLKVGITRSHQRLTRWMDQGAIAALPICEVHSRLESGLIEKAIAKVMSDKTDWRKLLRQDAEPLDLPALLQQHLQSLPELVASQPVGRLEVFRYPVLSYPSKINAYNLEKTPNLEDELIGIKGQYLIFTKGVLNLRKYAGYELEFTDP